MKSLYKKTTNPIEISRKISIGITSICLLIFLFTLFVPFNFTQAETKPLFISIGSGDLSSGKTTKITAYTNSENRSKAVNFKSTPESGTFTPSSCVTSGDTTKEYFSCVVDFVSKGGTFKITASTFPDNDTSNELSIINGVFTSACAPSKIYKAGVCIDPPPPTPPAVPTDTTYTPLAPLPGFETSFDTLPSETNKCPFGNYLNIMIKLILGIAGVLAMVMITMGGIQYMTSDLVSSKEAGKETVTNAILGLLIGLGAWLILNTINPALLSACLNRLPQATVTIEPLYDRGYNDPKQANGESTRCTPVTSGSCSVANLTTVFGAENAVAMSKICNMESGGTNATSTTDVCKPGNNAFSFGLFQVNLASNGIQAGSDCVGLFDKSVKGSDAISPKYTSGFTCSLLSGKEALYNTCKTRLLNSATNLAIAKKLFTPSKNAWKGDKKYCASAFK